jgi:radical SAM protein with 4Fe4S-binding SPASM domain
MNVMPDSSVLPCCVSPYDATYGNGKTESLKEIWNSEKFKTLRNNMLNEKASAGCARCYHLENSGFKSMRQEMNNFFKDSIPLAEKTKDDGSVSEMQLKYIDIRFSNLCNFKCRGCGPALSSSWQKDHDELFQSKPGEVKVKSIAVNSPYFWKELFSLIPHAEVIYFGGGEPLITKEHYEVLSTLNALGKHDIELRYTTNLSQLNYGDYNLSEIWKNFKKVTLGISIDDIGNRAEYFRHGTKWPVIEKNLQTLMTKYPQIIRSVNCTVNLMNVFHFSEIYEYTVLNGIVEPHEFNVNLLLDPDEMRIDVLPQHLKQKITVRLTKFRFKLQCMDSKFHYALRDIDSILNFMNASDKSHLIPEFIEKTAKLDKIRGEDFSSTYPELKF